MDRTPEDEIAPNFVQKSAQEIADEEEKENTRLFLLQDQQKRNAICDGKCKACHHQSRNHDNCWQCDEDNAAVEEYLRLQEHQ
jgi:hypothetical protein